MKTKLILLALFVAVFVSQIHAQNRTIIIAKNSDISDNLDLRAVASIFGDSKNLQDFERRLNDPNLQISNLDLNYDNQVDYLRVIESVENRTHLIIVQSVLDRDLYQDVATIEIEKDRYNEVHIQVVGNSFLYGQNYIYEPVYYTTPFIYATFWMSNYRPYYSSWSWNYYPSYYYAWNPFPIFRYRSNINICLNTYNNYNYVNYRRSNFAVNLYQSRRSDGYERQYPNRSFSQRNSDVSNRYELVQRRNTINGGNENRERYSQNRGDSQRNSSPQRNENSRDYVQRSSAPQRMESQRSSAPQRAESQREFSQNRGESQRSSVPQRAESQRGNSSSSSNRRS
jgi:hypothetical protein